MCMCVLDKKIAFWLNPAKIISTNFSDYNYGNQSCMNNSSVLDLGVLMNYSYSICPHCHNIIMYPFLQYRVAMYITPVGAAEE